MTSASSGFCACRRDEPFTTSTFPSAPRAILTTRRPLVGAASGLYFRRVREAGIRLRMLPCGQLGNDALRFYPTLRNNKEGGHHGDVGSLGADSRDRDAPERD